MSVSILGADERVQVTLYITMKFRIVNGLLLFCVLISFIHDVSETSQDQETLFDYKLGPPSDIIMEEILSLQAPGTKVRSFWGTCEYVIIRCADSRPTAYLCSGCSLKVYDVVVLHCLEIWMISYDVWYCKVITFSSSKDWGYISSHCTISNQTFFSLFMTSTQRRGTH